jgi:hypothetical protein
MKKEKVFIDIILKLEKTGINKKKKMLFGLIK